MACKVIKNCWGMNYVYSRKKAHMILINTIIKNAG